LNETSEGHREMEVRYSSLEVLKAERKLKDKQPTSTGSSKPGWYEGQTGLDTR